MEGGDVGVAGALELDIDRVSGKALRTSRSVGILKSLGL